MSDEVPEPSDDELAKLPPERLAEMVRDKRKAESTVRGKLREAEQSRDGLSTVVASLQRQQMRAAASSLSVRDEALDDLDAHIPLAEVLDENGLVSRELVKERVSTLEQTHPHYFRTVAPVSSVANRPSGDPLQPNRTTWGKVLGG